MKKLSICLLLVLSLWLTSKATENDKREKQKPKSVSASYYADKFHGRKTASGEIFDQKKYTAASNVYLLGTILKVTRITDKDTLSVTVKVNDRMHTRFSNRIDLTKAAMKKLEGTTKGIIKVNIEVIDGLEPNIL